MRLNAWMAEQRPTAATTCRSRAAAPVSRSLQLLLNAYAPAVDHVLCKLAR